MKKLLLLLLALPLIAEAKTSHVIAGAVAGYAVGKMSSDSQPVNSSQVVVQLNPKPNRATAICHIILNDWNRCGTGYPPTYINVYVKQLGYNYFARKQIVITEHTSLLILEVWN